MKKIAIITAAVASLGLAACQGNNATENTANTADTNMEATGGETLNDVNAASVDAMNAAENALDEAGNAVENASEAVSNAADNAQRYGVRLADEDPATASAGRERARAR